MDNSNQAAGQPVVQPVVPNNNASGGVVPAGKPGSSKGLIIGLICGIIGVAGIVLGIIFIPKLFGVNWEKTKEAGDNFYSVITKIDSDCDSLITNASSTSVSDKDYNNYASKCQDAVDELDDAVDAIGDSSGAKKNDTIKAKFEDFKKNYEKTGPVFKNMPDIFKAVHGFYVNVYSLDEEEIAALTDSDIDNLMKPLTESSVESIKNAGNQIADDFKEYFAVVKEYEEAYQLWWDTDYSAPNYDEVYERYQTARDAYYDIEEPEVDIETLLGVTEDDLTSFDTKARALYRAIESEYNKNS